MNKQSLALIIFSLRELQLNIQFAPNQILDTLKECYGIDIATQDDLREAISALIGEINCSEENV